MNWFSCYCQPPAVCFICICIKMIHLTWKIWLSPATDLNRTPEKENVSIAIQGEVSLLIRQWQMVSIWRSHGNVWPWLCFRRAQHSFGQSESTWLKYLWNLEPPCPLLMLPWHLVPTYTPKTICHRWITWLSQYLRDFGGWGVCVYVWRVCSRRLSTKWHVLVTLHAFVTKCLT